MLGPVFKARLFKSKQNAKRFVRQEVREAYYLPSSDQVDKIFDKSCYFSNGWWIVGEVDIVKGINELLRENEVSSEDE